MRLGLCFLSLAVVGLAVMLHDLTAQAHGKKRHAWRVAVAAAAAMAVVHQWILHLRPLVSVDLLLVALNAFLAAALLTLLVAPLLRRGLKANWFDPVFVPASPRTMSRRILAACRRDR